VLKQRHEAVPVAANLLEKFVRAFPMLSGDDRFR